MTRIVLLLSLACAAAILTYLFVHTDVFSLPSVVAPKETLRIGYAIEPPYAFLGADSEPMGVFVDAGRDIAHSLGYTSVEWVLTTLNDLIDELNQGRFDVIGAGLFVTADRSKRVRFADPLMVVENGLLKGANVTITSSDLAAWRNAEGRLAVIDGSVEEAFLYREAYPDSLIHSVPTANSGIIALNRGYADGFLLSKPALAWLSRQLPEPVVLMDSPLTSSSQNPIHPNFHAAFAFRLSDRSLVRRWNQAQSAWLKTNTTDESLYRLTLPDQNFAESSP